ncbi:hypothetical protein FY134_18210 [Agrobacterium fabrum]|nr:hypothetical protein FY134_18210 [Agrobacterium fabrum]
MLPECRWCHRQQQHPSTGDFFEATLYALRNVCEKPFKTVDLPQFRPRLNTAVRHSGERLGVLLVEVFVELIALSTYVDAGCTRFFLGKLKVNKRTLIATFFGVFVFLDVARPAAGLFFPVEPFAGQLLRIGDRRISKIVDLKSAFFEAKLIRWITLLEAHFFNCLLPSSILF